MLSDLKKKMPFLAVNLQAGEYLENFFVSAIFSIIFIRVFLLSLGYPQLGSENLHIAHMLWGGLLMMVALIFLLSFLSKQSRKIASIVGGLGFGIFIDELGKFVTKDNDYFFQPTFALIYLLFVLIFFSIRLVEKFIKVGDKDYKLNTLEVIKEVLIYDLDKVEKERGLRYLSRVKNKDKSIKLLLDLLSETKVVGEDDFTIITRMKIFFNHFYKHFIRKKNSASFISLVFMIGSLIVFGNSVLDIQMYNNFWDWGLFVSSLTSATFILIGVYFHRDKKYLNAYHMYRVAVIVAIFLTQFFQFYRQQLIALIVLMINMLALSALQFLIAQEKSFRQP